MSKIQLFGISEQLIASMDRKVLRNAGKVSRIEAEVKAHAEYKKYQVKILSPVEEAYLDTIKTVQKKVAKKMKDKNTKLKK